MSDEMHDLKLTDGLRVRIRIRTDTVQFEKTFKYKMANFVPHRIVGC